MKKLVSVILMAAMLFAFAACTPVSEDSIQPAAYRMEDELYPRLSLREDGTFSFVYTSMASRISKGTYSVADRVLKLECEDGTVYCFDVKRDCIVFNGELSDPFIKEFDNEPDIVDGTKFEFWRAFE